MADLDKQLDINVRTEPKSESESELDSSPSLDGPIVPSAQAVVPLKWKLTAILLVSAIGFGSHWSSGITGAMKTTMKKELHINNKQFALLEASEDFMVTALMLVSGVITDRIGGAGGLSLTTTSDGDTD